MKEGPGQETRDFIKKKPDAIDDQLAGTGKDLDGHTVALDLPSADPMA